MFEIKKAFAFSASHQLRDLPHTHQCARMHGHNYIVEVVLRSNELSNVGFVQDYGDLAPIKEWLDNRFDHRHLNENLDFNPTSELFAKFIYDKWIERYPLLYAVRISETPTSWAEYRAN
jgi:6-pyruvoyltetrahydropterin/6-carboxytetrahydropterin synthase